MRRLDCMRPVAGGLILVLALAGCSGDDAAARADESGPFEVAGFDADQSRRFNEAREQQLDALASTRDVVSRVGSAGQDELEQAMRTLNEALLRSRVEAHRLRVEKPSGHERAIEELRRIRREIRDAYDRLLAHHPDPTPDSVGLMDEE